MFTQTRTVMALSSGVAAMAVLVMASWHLRIDGFLQLHPQFVPMQYNTALCFLLTASALLLGAAGWRRVAALLAALVIGFALATVAQDLSGIALGLDQLLLRPHITVRTPHPGRMSPLTAISFCLLGIALLLAMARHGRAHSVGRLVTLVPGAIALASIIGYAFDSQPLIGWPSVTAVAVHTGIGLLLLTVVMMLGLRREGSPLWLEFLLLAGIAGGLLAWRLQVGELQQLQLQSHRERARVLAQRVQEAMDNPYTALQRMAARLDTSEREKLSAWERDADNYLAQVAGLKALLLVDEHGSLIQAVPTHLSAYASDDFLRRVGASAAESARDGSVATSLTAPFEDPSLGYVQISTQRFRFSDGGAARLMAIIDVSARIAPALADLAPNESLDLRQSGRIVIQRGETQDQGALSAHAEVALSSEPWQLQLRRQPDAVAGAPTVLALVVIVAVSYLAYGAAILMFRSRRQSIELVEANAHIGMLLDQVADAVIGLDAGLRVTSFNRAAQQLFNYPDRSALGRPLHALLEEVPSDSNGSTLDIMPKRIYRGVASDGTPLALECSLGAAGMQAEKQYVLTCRDVAERERIDQFKREFVSTVTHELRTPLTAIIGALKLLESGALLPLNEPAGRLVGVARSNSERLLVLINDLLDIEKIAVHGMVFEYELRPLQPLLEQAVGANAQYAERFGVALHLQPGEGDPLLRVDAHRLQQVLANLISNAAKFSQRRGRVDIGWSLREGAVRVEVIDYGRGIPAEFRERIFQRFAQSSASDARQSGGSGLGLAISRNLIEQMGGTMGFESVMGEGTTFWIELPLADATGEPSPAP